MGVAVSRMNDDKNEIALADGDKTIFDYCKEGSLKKVVDLFDGFPKDNEVRFLSSHRNGRF